MVAQGFTGQEVCEEVGAVPGAQAVSASAALICRRTPPLPKRAAGGKGSGQRVPAAERRTWEPRSSLPLCC